MVSAAAASDCSERLRRILKLSSDGVETTVEEGTIRKVGADSNNGVREGGPDDTRRGGDSWEGSAISGRRGAVTLMMITPPADWSSVVSRELVVTRPSGEHDKRSRPDPSY